MEGRSESDKGPIGWVEKGVRAFHTRHLPCMRLAMYPLDTMSHSSALRSFATLLARYSL